MPDAVRTRDQSMAYSRWLTGRGERDLTAVSAPCTYLPGPESGNLLLGPSLRADITLYSLSLFKLVYIISLSGKNGESGLSVFAGPAWSCNQAGLIFLLKHLKPN